MKDSKFGTFTLGWCLGCLFALFLHLFLECQQAELGHPYFITADEIEK